MTGEEAASLFRDGRLTIDIKDATDEDLKRLQKITGLKWVTGEDLSVDTRILKTGMHEYLICMRRICTTTNLIATFTRSYGRTVSIQEFLDLCCPEMEDINETDFEMLFSD